MYVLPLPESIMAFAGRPSTLQVVYAMSLLPSQARAGSGGGPPTAPTGNAGLELLTLSQ